VIRAAATRAKRKPSAILMQILTVLTVAVLIYIVIKTDFRLIWAHVRTIPVGLFGILLTLQLATQFALNYQWYRLCRVLDLPVTFWKMLVVNSYGTVVDAANPGEKVGGEVARVVQLNKILGMNTNQSTALVTIQKSLSLVSLVLLNMLAIVVLMGKVQFLRAWTVRLSLMALLIFIAGFLLYALFFTERLNGRVQRIKSTGKLAMWLKRWVRDFARDTRTISSRPKEWMFQFALSLAIWALFPTKLLIIVSQYTSINLFALFAITFLSYFAAMIPLLPGGLGTFEAAMSGMLIAYNLTVEGAMAISLIFRFITFWFVVLYSVVVILVWKARGRRRRL
jgi:uncharacterized protein (TIRG00374 family)